MRISYPRYNRVAVVERLQERLPALQRQLPVTRVALFGSYATGRHTAASDIDVLVIYAGPPRADAFATVKRTFGLRGLEPHVYTEAEAQTLQETLERMTRSSVLIYLA